MTQNEAEALFSARSIRTGFDRGVGQGGPTTTTFTDGGKDWDVNILTGMVLVVKIRADVVNIRLIKSNTANTITTVSAFTTVPPPESEYTIFANAFNVAFTDSTTPVLLRTPNIFKNVQASGANDTTVWTPTTGKKFRLMGGIVIFSGVVSSAAQVELQLQDTADGTIILDLAAEQPAAVATGETVVVPFNLGNGFLSAAVNNVLNADLITGYSSGAAFINVWGTEE